MAVKKHSLARRAFSSTRSFLRYFQAEEVAVPSPTKHKIRLAFIHNEKKLATGAGHINQLMSSALSRTGVQVRHFYPRLPLTDTPVHLKGIANILYFYSLLELKEKILSYDIIQGTTYTPLPFVPFGVPTVCHFGSTSRGFLENVPLSADLPSEQKKLYRALAKDEIIPEFEFGTLRPIQDVADIEEVTAIRASACIATSRKVQEELVRAGVPEDRIHIVHNAIEDYWFEAPIRPPQGEPHLVYLGRIGGEVFTLKLKGFSRLVAIYRAFPDVAKTTICMTTNKKLKDWMRVAFPRHHMFVNMRKDFIPGALSGRHGSILILPSRYEGFSLSLIEGMSQGLVPVSFPVGVAPEVIKDGVNGFLVTSETQAIAKIRKLLANDELRLSMADAARASAQQFRGARIAEQLLEVYMRIRSQSRAIRRKKTADLSIGGDS